MAAACNFTIINDFCTLETCCLEQSSFLYIPSFGGNLFFTVLFALGIGAQLYFAWRHRTWGFGIAMMSGLALEVIGYIGRLMLHSNPFNGNGFLIYLICVTIAPVFITAAIYLCLSRIVILYGERNSYFKPRTIATTFMVSDFLSLVLQAAGGGIADTANDHATKQGGINTMIGGLILQAVSLAIFLSYMSYFAFKCRSGVLDMAPEKSRARNTPIFKAFLVGLVVSTFVILIRSIFRVAELWEGFSGALWNSETDFLILDSSMITISVLLLTILHPGFAFREQWQASNWTFTTKSSKVKEAWNDHSSNSSAFQMQQSTGDARR